MKEVNRLHTLMHLEESSSTMFTQLGTQPTNGLATRLNVY